VQKLEKGRNKSWASVSHFRKEKVWKKNWVAANPF